ncbi:MAG: tetratricopeptide repeat protein [Opitutales bacterium]
MNPFLKPSIPVTALSRGASALLMLAMTAGTSAANQYWDRYGDQPVEIRQQSGGTTQTLTFVDFQDGMLIAQTDDGGGEISLPVNESMARNLRLDLDALSQVGGLVEQEEYDAALERLRPLAYPLIKFTPVPESFSQLHDTVQMLIDTLVNAGEYEEAEDILDRIQLDESPIRYSRSALRLLNAYLADEQFENAAELARSLPVQGDYAANIRPILDAADALRGADRYAAVIPLYRAIQDVVSGDARQNIRMWLAYSLVLDGQMDEARPMIDELEEPGVKDPLFSLYKLLHGSLAYREDQFGEALDILTRGFVRAQTSYQWVPEMLFLIGDCYARSDDLVAARNVWTEIAILYPESPWAARAEDSLDELPEEIKADD